MSERWMRRGLWLVLLVLVPLPTVAIQTAVIPVLRQWLLVAVTGLFLVLESSGGIGPLVLGILAAQALAGSLLLWGLAWGLVRGLRSWPPPRRAWLLGSLVLLGLALASVVPVYHTPYSARSLQSTLLQVYP